MGYSFPRDAMPSILILPGYTNSGPGHWQSLWEAQLPDARRVEMPNWDFPRRAEWIEALDAAIRIANDSGEPPLLVAHSLACILVAHWAGEFDQPVHGALLVAPTNVAREPAPEILRGFAPVPRLRLPFPSRVVASSDDPYLTLDEAKTFAESWGSAFSDVGPCGHLNTAAGFGPWPRGEAFLRELM
jgi:hypothetical protein